MNDDDLNAARGIALGCLLGALAWCIGLAAFNPGVALTILAWTR